MPRALVLMVSLFLAHASAPGAAHAAPRDAQKSLVMADRLRAKGQARKAERVLGRALGRAPDLLLALRYAELALPLQAPDAQTDARRRRAAALLLRSVSAAHGQAWPDMLAPHVALALALDGRFEAALQLADGASYTARTAWVSSLRAVASLAFQAQALAAANEALRRARALAPSDLGVLLELGMLSLARGDPRAALAPLTERFNLDPGSLSARRDLAYALGAAGMPDQGYALLSGARADCERTALCSLELARWALEARQLDAALREAEDALERAPDPIAALFLLAEVRVARGELVQARASYARILGLDPGQLRARAALEALDAAR